MEFLYKYEKENKETTINNELNEHDNPNFTEI